MPLGGLGLEHNRENAVVKAVRRVSPAVVNISSEYEVQRQVNPFSGFGMDPLFDSFFKDFFDPGDERRYKKTSLGSGVIIDGERGFILTNSHVTVRSAKITVILKDEREFETRIVGADPDSDLAVLQVDSEKPLPSIDMGNSDDLMIGETVIAIGNPFGFSNTVTTGVISALNRSIRTDDRIYHDFIQTDASINPGNSGGPLLDINGELIGINTAIYAKGQGIGFAIPINKAKKIISDLIKYGEVVPAWIGITVQDLDARLARYLKLYEDKGLVVKAVEPTGPAHKKGVLEGDILISINDRKIESARDYQAVMKDFAAGDTLKLEIFRNGKRKTIVVTAGVFPLELSQDLAYNLIGIKVKDVKNINSSESKVTSRKGAVIYEINSQSYLARIGVKPGDIVRQLDDIQINDKMDFEKAIIKYRQKPAVIILLQRGDEGYYISVKL
jgi:serine protease Do